jgi:hypothetical protein
MRLLVAGVGVQEREIVELEAHLAGFDVFINDLLLRRAREAAAPGALIIAPLLENDRRVRVTHRLVAHGDTAVVKRWHADGLVGRGGGVPAAAVDDEGQHNQQRESADAAER